jgi:Flp pilus assembly protein TadG
MYDPPKYGPARACFWCSRCGSGSLEFALVALPFITFLVFLLEIGYDLFAQAALDYGVQTAARQIQIGRAQSARTAGEFQTSYLCPALTGLLPCSAVRVSVVPITTDYYATVPPPTNGAGELDLAGFTYCPGMPNQLMLVQAIYISPSMVSVVFPSMGATIAGGLTRVTLSSTAFINENFPIDTASPAGC